MTGDRPLAFVVQRYGADIVGGSESLCRSVAEMVAGSRRVDVLTTCARDYGTWRNELPAGVTEVNGVTVRRFVVDFERDERFHRALGAILGGQPLDAYPRQRWQMRRQIASSSEQSQRDCLKLQGPYSTPLLEHLERHHQDYGLVVFFTYLYATTFFGCRKVPAERTLLVPTAHDEPPIYMPVFRSMFARFPAYIFLTPEEKRFVHETFAVGEALQSTIGMPVELAGRPDAERFRQKYGIHGPFVLYAGRVDPSKGCDEMFRYFSAARSHLPPELKMMLIGQTAMDLTDDSRVRYLGRLPEQDKADAMAAASLLINPSPFESFSIVVLEAMLCGTPVLVNGRCDVLKGHVRRSCGGLYYDSGYEFVEALRLMLADDGLRARMGANGAEYVRHSYGRSVVEQRYHAALEQAERRGQSQKGREAKSV